MNTSLLFDYEPVADGGFFVRLVLLLAGGARRRAPTSDAAGQAVVSHSSPTLPTARNVQVAVRPGRDAEFIQMTHAFESAGSGSLLTIAVGDLYSADRVRIRMEALVGPGHGVHEESDVGRLVILANVDGRGGGVELRTVNLPIRLSATRGGRVLPALGSMPVSQDVVSRIRRAAGRPAVDDGSEPPRCA
ncbi:MAG: hypothetical protein R3304_11860 [Longimicrobiales bacterium]|nr:hypothetical protein [Longimicrobiales bacterium]